MINNAWAGTMNMRAEINRLHADVGRLTKERDDEKERAESLERQLTTALVHHEAAYNDSIAAEKSRDEAVAELNKALEKLRQLRSDLRRAEDARDGLFELFRVCEEARANADFDGTVPDCIKYLDDRAQSAEASLAKLREAAIGLVRCVEEYDVGIGLPRLLGVGDRQSFEALRSLLDEHDKDQKQ